MYDMWLFGFRKCRIIEDYKDGQVLVELENGCRMAIYQDLVYSEETNEKDKIRSTTRF